jgi:hypothetical protein
VKILFCYPDRSVRKTKKIVTKSLTRQLQGHAQRI